MLQSFVVLIALVFYHFLVKKILLKNIRTGLLKSSLVDMFLNNMKEYNLLTANKTFTTKYTVNTV